MVCVDLNLLVGMGVKMCCEEDGGGFRKEVRRFLCSGEEFGGVGG